MIDFLRVQPQVTKDEYLWEWTVPQIKLSLFDNTHVESLNEKQAEIEKARRKGDIFSSARSLVNDLGGVVI